MSMGHARLVCTQIFSTPYEGLGLTGSLLPPMGHSMILSVEETLMNFDYPYASNLIHQGASVIIEILSTNGYRNPTSSNNYEFTHGPKLPKNHFQKVQNYTTSYKIKMRYDYIGRARTCTITKCRKSAHVHDA
jgi:hypothetical protein